MQTLERTSPTTGGIPSIPEVLVYEQANDRPLYYRGYKAYLEGEKTLGALMGSSYLQAFIIMQLITHFIKHLPNTYHLLANELGIIHKAGNWRSLDLAIYRRDDLKGIPLENKYLRVPPKVAIEVDTKIDFEAFTTPLDYVHEKMDDLLRFGVEKVIWIFTHTRKVMIATPQAQWTTMNWSDPSAVIEDVVIRLEEMIAALD